MSERILVVEDNDDIALVVKTTLNMRQYEVEVASDGIQGLEKAFSSHFDLIVLDVLLPELDGYEVLKRLKADPKTKDIPVALFSAHMSEQESRSALKNGAAAVLVKPFEPRQFVERIGELLADG